MKYTEKKTEKLYDEDDKVYQSFWNNDGSLHWGYFKSGNRNNFSKASKDLTDLLAKKAKINSKSTVLDLGCGNGTVSIYLSKKYRCKVVGIDLSGVRIKNAKVKALKEGKSIRDRVSFIRCSASKLPLKDNSFSHVFSHATIYHVHDKDAAFKEIKRVLKGKGVLAFDDLIKIKKAVSPDARKYVYDRLIFNTDFKFKSYQSYLKNVGFKIAEAKDISDHLAKSYDLIAKVLGRKIKENKDKNFISKYKKLEIAYRKMVELVNNGELGQAYYIARKL